LASILTLATGLNAILKCAESDFFIAIAMVPWMVRTLADSAMLFEAMAGPAPLDARVAGKILHSSQSVEVRTDAWFILALLHCLSTQSAIAVAAARAALQLAS
jgi:hypothetical protein